MQETETWVRSLSVEGPLEKEVVTHSSFSPGRFHGQKNWWAAVRGVAESDATEHTRAHAACCGEEPQCLKDCAGGTLGCLNARLILWRKGRLSYMSAFL